MLEAGIKVGIQLFLYCFGRKGSASKVKSCESIAHGYKMRFVSIRVHEHEKRTAGSR